MTTAIFDLINFNEGAYLHQNLGGGGKQENEQAHVLGSGIHGANFKVTWNWCCVVKQLLVPVKVFESKFIEQCIKKILSD